MRHKEHHECWKEAPQWSWEVYDMLSLILENQEATLATIQELQDAVKREQDAEDAVIVLLKGISQQLKDAQGNPQAIQDVITQLDANTARLGAAVVENTPANA